MKPQTRSLTRPLVGLAIAAIGTGLLLDALNVLDFSGWLADWWPVLVILIGLASLASNPQLYMWPLFIIAAGTLLLLREQNVLEFNVWGLIWPSALIIIGLSFLTDRFSPKPKASSEGRVDLCTVFSGINAQNRSNNFTGGKMTAAFGGITLDLRDAEIKKNATIDMFVAFGGIELRVPEEWTVHTSGLPLFGGWEDKTAKPDGKRSPVLNVRGTCMFGGVEIKN